MFGCVLGGVFFWAVVSKIIGLFITLPGWTSPVIFGVGFLLCLWLDVWMEGGGPRRFKERRAERKRTAHLQDDPFAPHPGGRLIRELAGMNPAGWDGSCAFCSAELPEHPAMGKRRHHAKRCPWATAVRWMRKDLAS